jgi:hypothetical protein
LGLRGRGNRGVENTQLKDLLSVLLTKYYYSGDQVKKNKIGWACSLYGVKVRIVYWCGNLGERDHLEYLGVDGRVMLKWVVKK